jgi:hypothetical protein
MPDAVLARNLRRTFYSIQVQRIRQGIPIFGRRPDWKPEHLALLGKVPDAEAAGYYRLTSDF